MCKAAGLIDDWGHLLRFKLNSTATSGGSTQNLGNDVKRDSESIATKVCSQIGLK